MVAPTISSPVCQEQLIEAGKLVAKSVEGCVEASQGATNDEQLLKQVGVAATGVTQALNELLQHIKQYASGSQPIGRHGEATDRILDVTENIFSSMGDAGRERAVASGWGAGLVGSWGRVVGSVQVVVQAGFVGVACAQVKGIPMDFRSLKTSVPFQFTSMGGKKVIGHHLNLFFKFVNYIFIH